MTSALVTGAGSGIGEAITRELIGRGYDVMALDNRVDRLEGLQAEVGVNHLSTVAADVGDETDVSRAIVLTLKRFGSIDVLCSNAGILDDYLPAGETSLELWDRVLRVNLTGMFLMARAVIPGMVERGRGAIVNTASVASFVAGGGGTAYTAAKRGVLGLTRQLAFDYGQKGVRVNAVCPGPVCAPGLLPISSRPRAASRTSITSSWAHPLAVGLIWPRWRGSLPRAPRTSSMGAGSFHRSSLGPSCGAVRHASDQWWSSALTSAGAGRLGDIAGDRSNDVRRRAATA